MTPKILVPSILATLFACAAHAQLLCNPAVHPESGRWDIGLGYTDIEVQYDVPSRYRFYTPTFGNKTLFLSAGYGINGSIDAFASLARIDDLDNSDHPSVSGDGTAVAAGLNCAMFREGAVEIDLFGQFLRMDTSFSDEIVAKPSLPVYRSSRDITQYMLTLGAVGVVTWNQFHFSAGPEWIAYEDGTYDFLTVERDSGAFFEKGPLEIDHSDTLAGRIGVAYDAVAFSVFLNAAAGYEDSVTLGAGLHF